MKTTILERIAEENSRTSVCQLRYNNIREDYNNGLTFYSFQF